jgi:hypothetical protein
VHYSNVNARTQFTIGVSQYEEVYNRANVIVFAVLVTAESLEWIPEDAWSHPKIPQTDELEATESEDPVDRP